LRFEASTALLSSKRLALALTPIAFETEGTFDFGPQLVLVAHSFLPFHHGNGSWLDFFKYRVVELGLQPLAEHNGHALGIWLLAGLKTEVVELGNVCV
jgi:hypothetical protein